MPAVQKHKMQHMTCTNC